MRKLLRTHERLKGTGVGFQVAVECTVRGQQNNRRAGGERLHQKPVKHRGSFGALRQQRQRLLTRPADRAAHAVSGNLQLAQ